LEILFSQCKHIADSAVGVSAVVAGVVGCWGAAGSIEELAIMLGLMLVVRLFRLFGWILIRESPATGPGMSPANVFGFWPRS